MSDIFTILHFSALNYFGFFNADKFVEILFRPWLSVLAHAILNLHNSSNVLKKSGGAAGLVGTKMILVGTLKLPRLPAPLEALSRATSCTATCCDGM